MSSKPNEGLNPRAFLRFVETNEFVQQWESLGFDVEKDLWGLQIMLMRNPEVGKVISGTGGLRKMRFSRSADRIGKRGGVRVCYVHFKEHAILLLITAYGKNEKDDLMAAEKKSIREYIIRAKAGLDRQRDSKGG